MSDIKKEILVNNQTITVPSEEILLNKMADYICEIYKENEKIWIGFFCNVPLFDEKLPFLITNNHILNEKDIENNEIKLIINKINKRIKIDIIRKKYTNKDLDITFIEIKPEEDNIKNFMELDEGIKNNNILKSNCSKKSIYILHYLKEKLCVSYGLIDEIIEGRKINYYSNKEEESLDGPILSLETSQIIGINYGGNNKKLKFGTFLKYAIEKFKNDTKKFRKEINLIYFSYNGYDPSLYTDEEEQIFGEKFVENNKNIIELIINGKKSISKQISITRRW